MVDYTDAELEDYLKAASTPEAQNIMGTQTTLSDEEMSARPELAETPETPIKLGAEATPSRYSNPWTAPLQAIFDGGEIGEETVIRGHAGYDLYNRTDLTLSQEVTAAKNATPENLKALKMDLNTYNEQTAFKLFGFDVNPAHAIGLAAQQLPFMREVAVGSAKGAATGAVAGGAVAATVGALGGSFVGPEGTVVGGAAGWMEGAITGARIGAKAGQFQTTAKLTAGDFYLTAIERGATKETAQKTAAAVGIVSGALEVLEVKFYGDAAKHSMQGYLKTKAGKQFVKDLVADYFKTIGKEVATEEAQEITGYVGELLNASLDKNEALRPGGVFEKRGDQASLFSRMVDTAYQTTITAGVITGGSQAAGAGAGAVTDKTKAVLNSKSAKDVISSLSEGMRNVQPSVSEVQEAQAQTTDEAVDTIAQPVQGKEATLVEDQKGTTLKASVTEDVGRKALLAEEERTTEAQTPDQPPEMKARVKQIDKDTKGVDKDIASTEEEFTKRDNANTRATELKTELADLSNRQKSNAAHITQLNKDVKAKEKAGKDTTNIWKTLDKIGADQESIVNQMEKAKAELETLETGPTTALTAKLEKLYDQRGNLDTERALINEGLLTPEEIKNAKVTMTVGQLSASRAKAAQQMIQNFKKGMKEGVKFTKDDIKMVQNRLVSLLRDSELTPADKSKFLETVRNIQTPEQLEKALPKIEKRVAVLVEKQAKRDAGKRLATVWKRASLKKNGKYAEGKYDANTQQVLDLYSVMAKDESARDKARQAFNDALLGDGDIPPMVILANQIADEMATLKDKHSKELNRLADALQDMIDTGRTKRLEQLEKEQAERQALHEATVASIQGDKPYQKSERTDSLKNNLRKIARTFFATAETWRGLMTMISQHDKSKALVKMFDHNAIRETFFQMHGDWETQVSNHLKDALQSVANGVKITPKMLAKKLAADEHKDPNGLGEYQDASGVPQVLYRSRAEARKLWMEFQAAKVDPIIRQSLEEGNGFTFNDSETIQPGEVSTEQLLEQVLTPEDIALANAQFEIYEKLYNDVLNPYWRSRYGVDLPKVEMYSPIAREGFDVNDTTTLLQHFVGTGGIKPSSVIKRTGSILPLGEQSDIETLARHTEKVIRYVTYDKFDQTTKQVFLNGEIRTLIQNKYGVDVYTMIRSHRQDINVGRAAFNDVAWRFVGGLRKRISTAFTGAKIGAIPKQATAMVTALAEVGPIRFIKSATRVHVNPKGAVATLSKSATFRQIIRSNNRDIVEVLNAQKVKSPGAGEGILGLMMAPVRFGVAYGATVSGMAVYDQSRENGMSEAEALGEMNRFLSDTQQSGFIEEQSAKERAGELGKALTMFGGDPLQASRKLIRAYRDVVNFPTDKKMWGTALKNYAVFHLTVPLAFQIMSNAVSSRDDEHDEDRLWRTAVLGPFGQIPIIGDALAMAYVGVSNVVTGDDEFIFEPSSPLLSVLTAAAVSVKNGAKYMSTGEENDMYKAIHSLSKSAALVSGTPWQEFANWFVPRPDDNVAKEGSEADALLK
jgi:hypothetical protein